MNEPSPAWFHLLCCPVCKQTLDHGDGTALVCTAAGCGRKYPIANGLPVLINEDTSVFRIDDFLTRKQTTFRRGGALKSMVARCLPTASVNLKARKNYKNLERLLLEASPRPRVLVVGGGELGQGMGEFAANERIEFVHSDVALEPLTKLVAPGNE